MSRAEDLDLEGLPSLITKKAVAEWAQCSTRHIEYLVERGEFPQPIRIGTHPRWRRSDLLQWLNSQTSKTCGLCGKHGCELLELQDGGVVCEQCFDKST